MMLPSAVMLCLASMAATVEVVVLARKGMVAEVIL
jgi:hypothetical protein